MGMLETVVGPVMESLYWGFCLLADQLFLCIGASGGHYGAASFWMAAPFGW
jgi:hypothetical protein